MPARKKKKTGLISKGLLLINAFFALFLLLSYLAAYVNPETFWPLAFLGLAYPGFLFINFLFLIFWLFKKPLFALLPVLSILLGWGFVLDYIGFRDSTAISVPKTSKQFLRVLTYNVHNFKQFGDKNDTFTKDQILDIIRNEQPDVICFQEFYTRNKGEYNFKKLISEILNSTQYFIVPHSENEYETIGMAIFSKLPIKKTRIVPFENASGNETMYVDVVWHKQLVRIFNVHFQSINFQPEDYNYINEVKKAEANVSSSRRIGSRLKQAFIRRSRQVELVKAMTDSCKTPYIIAGDFNDTPISYAVNTMSKGLVNSFRKKGSGLGVTYNGDFPNFQIDYILSTPDFTVKNHQIVKKVLSDHYAVRSDLELNSKFIPQKK